ncbi:MAG: WcaI family glycosyltransferase [Brevundimonas sp.]|uniref:WcaI family glycosyltransferase n=1 Tax=Brevundimonas sp. TaxID=1871086 RepID=UPI003918CE43
MDTRKRAAREDRALKVLFCGMHHAPELIGIGKYSGELAEHLASVGHRVTVVTAQPHYPEWSVRPPYRNRYADETCNGVRIHRAPLLLKSPMKGVWRLIAPLSFAAFASPVVLWRALRERPDVVVCVAPTLFLAPAAWLAARMTGAGSALHIQDLEIDAAFVVGHLKAGLMQRLALGFERWVMRRFDRVITISGRMAERIVAKGVETGRVTVLRNWVDLEKIRPLEGPNGYRQTLGVQDDQFVVLYAGAIGRKQALHIVLEAATLLGDRADIRFIIAGDGPELPVLKGRYESQPNVDFLPLQPADKLCDLLNAADVHVLPQDRDMADLVLPSKLGGVLASGRRLVVMADPGTELHSFLGDVATIIEPGNSGALADAIVHLRGAPGGLHAEGVALASKLDARRNLGDFEALLRGLARRSFTV